MRQEKSYILPFTLKAGQPLNKKICMKNEKAPISQYLSHIFKFKKDFPLLARVFPFVG
jgi:hypothetical protein